MDFLTELIKNSSPTYAYFAITAAAFVDSLLLVGLIVNGLALFTVAITLYTAGVVNIFHVLLFSFIGAVLADNIGYAIGHLLGERPKHWWPLKKKPKAYDSGVGMVRKYGIFAIFIGRFFAITRSVVPFVCGVFKMPYTVFAITNIVTCAIWVAVWSVVLYMIASGV